VHSGGGGGGFRNLLNSIRARQERQAALDKSARLYGSDPKSGRLTQDATTVKKRVFQRLI